MKEKSDKQIKVLHCAETIKGGIATYLNTLLTEHKQSSKLKNFLLISPKSHKNEIIPNLIDNCYFFNDTKNRIFNSLKLTLAVIKASFAFKPDIVHVHSFLAGLFLRPVLFFTNSRVVYCPHGWSFDRRTNIFSSRLSAFIEYILSFFTHKIICISDHEKLSAKFINNSSNKLVLIKNAINTQSYADHIIGNTRDWPNDKLKLLFVGRYDRQKGLDILLEAIKDIQNEVSLIVIGGNVLDDRSDNSLQIQNMKHIKEIGWVDSINLKNYYYAADLLVMPSRWEGFGLVAIEAMSCGLPVVASDVGGLSEIVLENVTGKLFKSESSSELLKILKTLSRDDLKTMSINSLDRVKNLYDITRLNNEITSLYNKIVHKKDI